MDIQLILFVVVALLLGFAVGYFLRKHLAEAKIASAEAEAEKIIKTAVEQAEAKKREAILEAKEEVLRFRNEAEREYKERRNELQKIERRLLQKEENLDRKIEMNEKREESLCLKEQEIEKLKLETEEVLNQQKAELERISGMTSEEAKQTLIESIKQEVQSDAALLVKEIEQKAKEEGERRARDIITLAIQRCAADHVADVTVAVVPLPNDDMKGRIIGREGRNIRSFETFTGVDLIIDDTPEAVLVSSFDPIRREVARIALEKLIIDGRIHPGRIEEMVEKARKEVDIQIREAGEQATFETGVHGLHPELIKLLGKLKFRASYGQNVLKHSIEVSHLAGLMASELGIDNKAAKRAGLLHDVGKAVDHEVEGSHVAIGVDLCKKYNESPEVIHAVAAHHGDEEPKTIEAVLVQAADAISAARPGARREMLESYIRRLQKLEEIANSFERVEKAFAIQAGREVRIMVKPEQVDDLGAVKIAREITKKIEEGLEYPGQIKVVIIRETRAVDYAK
ncbi:ribonuclease Y [Peptococcaceae bacterium]|nr:ribonuclease Y [Peptococcaceae bacterium]